MASSLPVFFYLDPFQWTLLVTSFVAGGMCLYSFLKNRPYRLTMGLLFFFNFYIILRYVLVIIFRLDSSVLSNTEILIINTLSQTAQIYIVLVIILLVNSVLREVKGKKNGVMQLHE
jgi:hypothetical protein